MKYRRPPRFDADWAKLPAEHKQAFLRVLNDTFLPACDRFAEHPNRFTWPASLRFEMLESAGGVCAITWSFSGPDGRATLQFVTEAGESICVWRRIGPHEIYREP